MKYSYKAVFLSEYAARLISRDCVSPVLHAHKPLFQGRRGATGRGEGGGGRVFKVLEKFCSEVSHTFCSTFICIAFDLLVGVCIHPQNLLVWNHRQINRIRYEDDIISGLKVV